LFPFTHRCYKPNLVEIGSVVPEKKLKCFKVYDRLRTDDDGRKRIAIGHLSDSGDLKILICSKSIKHIFVFQRPMQRYWQFCMCAEALWMQEINALFNSMKTPIIVLKFAMYSLELKIKLKKINYFRPTYPIFFIFHNISGNTAFFLSGLIELVQIIYV
jgi:hypothetical protein